MKVGKNIAAVANWAHVFALSIQLFIIWAYFSSVMSLSRIAELGDPEFRTRAKTGGCDA